MTRKNRHYTAIALALIMIFAAGCAGWGTDGPDEGEDPEPTEGDADDLEEADSDATDDAGGGNGDTDTDDAETDGSSPESDTDDESAGGVVDSVTDAIFGDGEEDSDESPESDDTAGEDTAPPTDDSDTDESPPSDDNSDGDAGDGESPPADGSNGDAGNGDDNGESPPTDSNGTDNGDNGVSPPSNGDDNDDADNGDDTGDAGNGDDNGDAGNGDDNGDHQDRYDFSMTVPVVDEAGDPVEGYTVLIGPPGEDPTEYTTDANGEATTEFWNTDPDDAIQLEATVDGETRQGHGMHGGMTMAPFVVSTGGNGDNGDADTHTLTLNVVGEDGMAQEADFVVEGADGERLTGDNFNGPAAFDLEPGEYTVTAYTEAFSDTFRLDGEGMEVVDLTEDTEIVFTGYHDNPGESGTHTLTVETNAPVHGLDIPIQVSSEDDPEFETVTQNVDDSGVTTFELPDGKYLVDSVDVCRNASAAAHPVVIDGDDHSESIVGPEWADPGQDPPTDCVNGENGENGEDAVEDDGQQLAVA